MKYEIERMLLSSKVVGEDCWQEKHSKGFKMRLRNCPFNLLVIQVRINLKRGNDTIQERSNSDFDVKCATIQFYGNRHNSQFDRWIGLKVYVVSPDMLSYLGLKFQVNQSSRKASRYWSTKAVQILLFTFFSLVDFLFG